MESMFKERVKKKSRYYGLNFEEFVQKRYPWRCSRLYKPNLKNERINIT